MKNTIATVALFVLLYFVFSNNALAWTIPNIRIVTIAPTPTLIIIDPNINLKLIPTATPTLGTKMTVTPMPTIEEKMENTPTVKKTLPTETEELTTTVTQTQTLEPSVEATKTEEMVENKPDLKTWFMGITMGLLVLIIIIQLLPKKKEDQ